jgi:hypothetical protein
MGVKCGLFEGKKLQLFQNEELIKILCPNNDKWAVNTWQEILTYHKYGQGEIGKAAVSYAFN